MFSNMKILTPTSQQNATASIPSPTRNQQTLTQQGGSGAGGGSGNAPKDFNGNQGGGTGQKSNKRDQHQKHNGGSNKAKYNHSNGGGGGKMQQMSMQQQKYHHNSNNNKNKKQHYNNNNNSSNSSSSLNRKKFYQQQQNALQQLHYHNQQQHHHHHQQQQQQYLSNQQQKMQQSVMNATTTNTNTTNNNNNCQLSRNQNYNAMDLIQQNALNKTSSASNGSNNSNNNSINFPSHNDSNSVSSTTTVSTETCNCNTPQNHECDKISNYSMSSSSSDKQQCTITSSDTMHSRSTMSSTSQNMVNSCASGSQAVEGGCKCCTNFSKLQTPSISSAITTTSNIGNMKSSNKNKKSLSSNESNNSSRQYYCDMDATAKCKCNCSYHNSLNVPNVNLSSSSTSSSSKKKSSWKNNNYCNNNGVGTCDPMSPKLSKEKEHMVEKLGTKRCECACNSLALNSVVDGDTFIQSSSQRKQQSSTTMNVVAAYSNNGSSRISSSTTSSPTDISCISSSGIENSFAMTPNSKSKCSNSSLTIDDIEAVDKMKGSSNSGCIDSNRSTQMDATKSSSNRSPTSGHSSPGSYSLDFLHAVGVQMSTGGMKVMDVNSGGVSGNTMRPITGGLPAAAVNHRQQRYVFGGHNGNNHPYQHHHHHPQPTQLTIASFLQKDILGEHLLSNVNNSNVSTAASNSGHSSSNNMGTHNYNDQQSTNQSHYARPNQSSRYYGNYYQTSPYHQHQSSSQTVLSQLHSCSGYNNNSNISSAVGGDMTRYTTSSGNPRPVYGGGGGGGYLNYNHNNIITNNSMPYSNQNFPQSQEQSRMRLCQNNCCKSGGCVDASTSSAAVLTKKSSHGSCSSASSCSSSSSASSSSSSSSSTSCGSNRKTQQTTNSSHNPQKSVASQNLAIETLTSSKLSSQQGNNQRHRGHSHHGHGGQQQNHHSHQNHYGGHHHHHHHAMGGNTPSTPQHQNYYNLTYVSTDGSNVSGMNTGMSGTNSRGCSPAPPVLPPTPSSSNPSPKSLENCPGPVAMMANLHLGSTNQINYARYASNQGPPGHQLHHYQQQQQILNKKMLPPLTLNVPSPSPSPTPSHILGTLSVAGTQPPVLGPHNIICCSQLDEASTAAAAAAAKTTGIIAGNDYDSDASSTHSSAVSSNTAQNKKYQSYKTLSISSSSSATSLCNAGGQQQQQQECKSQPGTPVDVNASTTPLGSPIDYNAYAVSSVHAAFPSIEASSTVGALHNHPQQQQQQHHHYINQSQLVSKATAATQLPHVYHNGVISLLNLPTHSPVNNCERMCSNYLEEEYHQQQQRQQPQFFLTSSSNQSSAEQLNIVSALSAGTSRSNSSSGYWSPSHQCNFLYHQLSSTSSGTGGSANNLILPNTPSCGSTSSSISPSLPDLQQTQQQQQQIVHKPFPTSGSSSPSTCSSCFNDQLGMAEGCSSTASSSSNSSVSGRGNAFVASVEKGSTQLLTQQQQRLNVQQTQQHSCSPSLPISNNSSSAISSGQQRNRNTGNGRSHQYLQNHSYMTASAASSGPIGNTNNNGQQTMLSNMFPHQQMQTLPPPPTPHNLLYNNPQASHHLRSLSNSSVHDFFTHTPPDRFLARAHLIEAKEAPSALLNNSKWDKLSQDIWNKFICSQQTEETFKQKMRLWRYLYLFIKNAYPRYGLYLVGSTISGFGSDSSDVDMCLVSRSASNIDPRMEALFNLTVLRDCLSKSGEFEYFNLIEAKVPILRFRDRVHQLEVDLNFNNCVGIKNTHLLYCYSQLDWRLRPMVLVTKLWAQHHNINNAKNMTISSYSLVLMVIHFLQYAVKPAVLPCLHELFPEKFPLLRSNDFGYVDMNETIGPYESKNTQTLGELFLDFLEYYSNFDYSQNAISVRTGGILPINVCRTAKSLKNDIHQWKELCIEEPFDLTNTARSVYDYETFERVKSVFVSSWHALRDSLDLNSVFVPITDTSSTSQTSSTLGDDNSLGADSTHMTNKDIHDDHTALSWSEDQYSIESSENSCPSSSSLKHMVKCRGESSSHISRDNPGASPPTFSTRSGHSSSTSMSFNTKHNNNAALIS
ncbi:uncharacterized protein [Musca autumnalis]|uniref:uncharacterized protein n=1 Tax=Musca autumnalis TaxID=221902 RepID=UPI003CF0F7C0